MEQASAFLQFDLETSHIANVTLRLTVAALLGGLIGFDRELRDVPAGLRTHMLVAMAAAAFTLLAFEIVDAAHAEGTDKTDPVRIIEAVTAGVAFLAAGTIIRGGGEQIQGLTTGAAMWLAGAVGLACGVGSFTIAAVATVLGLIILTGLRWVSHSISAHAGDGEQGPAAGKRGNRRPRD